MINTRIIELDVSKEGTGTCVRVGQGDSGGTTIKALIYDNGSDFDLSGCVAFLVTRLPNKRNYYRGQCSVSGNAATITIDESKLCSIAGYTDEAYFTIEKDGHTYSTERFALDIVRSALDGQPGKSWDDSVQKIIDKANAATEAANEAAESATNASNGANEAASEASNAAGRANVAAAAAETAATAITGNVLKGTLGPAEVLMADDTYAQTPFDITVYGDSSQDDGVPSPENPLPITSVSELSVTLAGKNLAIFSNASKVGGAGGNLVSKTESTIEYSGASSNTDTVFYLGLEFPPGEYCISYGEYVSNIATDIEPITGGSMPFNAYWNLYYGRPTTPLKFDKPFHLYISPKQGSGTIDDFQIELGSTATEYEQPQVTTKTIDLKGNELCSFPDGTRDELDLVTGKLKKVLGFSSDLSSETVNKFTTGSSESNTSRISFNVNAVIAETGNALLVPGYIGRYSNQDKSCYISSSRIVICDQRFTSESVALSLLSGISALYKINEQIIQIAPVELPALPAPNLTVWANANVPAEISIAYARDINIAFQKLESYIAQNTIQAATN